MEHTIQYLLMLAYLAFNLILLEDWIGHADSLTNLGNRQMLLQEGIFYTEEKEGHNILSHKLMLFSLY